MENVVLRAKEGDSPSKYITSKSLVLLILGKYFYIFFFQGDEEEGFFFRYVLLYITTVYKNDVSGSFKLFRVLFEYVEESMT